MRLPPADYDEIDPRTHGLTPVLSGDTRIDAPSRPLTNVVTGIHRGHGSTRGEAMPAVMQNFFWDQVHRRWKRKRE